MRLNNLALITTIRKRLLVENVTPHGVQAVINDMTDIAATIKRRGASIGFQVYFSADQNSPSELRLGKFTVGFKQEEPAPITLIDIESSTDYPALTVELQEIIQNVSTTVTSG